LDAIEQGYTVALWLDLQTRRSIDELSGMNIFAVVDGELHTPKLTDSILPSITRDSLITFARYRGWTAIERPMPIDELLGQIRSGTCTEVFTCGTAAIVSPIGVIGERGGTRYTPAVVDGLASQLREALLAIQESARRTASAGRRTFRPRPFQSARIGRSVLKLRPSLPKYEARTSASTSPPGH
jgi:branched-chain amino acid aminotransferase